MERFGAQLSALFADFERDFSRSINETFSGIASELRRTSAELEPDALRMGKLGWTVPTWEALPLVRAIARNVPPDALDDYFVSEYGKRWREQERALLRELPARPVLQKWSPLMHEVIYCYQKRRYLVAVPALLAIFEGAVAEAAKRADSDHRPAKIIAAHVQGLQPGVERLAWVSLIGFCSAVFGYHHFAEAAPSRLNRHWVLHGRSDPAWTRVDCLRLFQALDTLAALTGDPEMPRP